MDLESIEFVSLFITFVQMFSAGLGAGLGVYFAFKLFLYKLDGMIQRIEKNILTNYDKEMDKHNEQIVSNQKEIISNQEEMSKYLYKIKNSNA